MNNDGMRSYTNWDNPLAEFFSLNMKGMSTPCSGCTVMQDVWPLGT